MFATSPYKASRLSTFQMWLFSILFPMLHASYKQLLVDRDTAQAKCIQLERYLSIYRPLCNFAITDEQLQARLGDYAARVGGEQIS